MTALAGYCEAGYGQLLKTVGSRFSPACHSDATNSRSSQIRDLPTPKAYPEQALPAVCPGYGVFLRRLLEDRHHIRCRGFFWVSCSGATALPACGTATGVTGGSVFGTNIDATVVVRGVSGMSGFHCVSLRL